MGNRSLSRFLTSLAFLGLAATTAPAAVVINEIMYHPADDMETLQYVELFNPGETEADLTGWSFSKGVTFQFPAGTKLPARGFLVIARKRADFNKAYSSALPVVGDFQGTLSHGGERIELIDSASRVVDAVTYSDHAPWPLAPDGESASLERISPMGSSGAENWAPSQFSPKAAGTPGRVNTVFSANPPPALSEIVLSPPTPATNQPTVVRATVADADRVRTVTLLYRIVRAGAAGTETSLPMQRVSGDELNGTYEAAIPAQPRDRLVRYRFRAVDSAGTERWFPSTNDVRPSLTYSTFLNTNQTQIPFGFVVSPVAQKPPPERSGPFPPTRGSNAFVYLPAGGGATEVFDHVEVVPRKAGFKIRFLKDQPFQNMSSVNLVFESLPRRALTEEFSYVLYRLAGVPTEFSEFVRLSIGGRLNGYYLLVEQPNKAFLRRMGRDDTGNMYKFIWYKSGLVAQHEKKTNPSSSHDDLQTVLRDLNQRKATEQWTFIEKNFNVDDWINYFAVNMCISNWDGFFNNYFLYHIPGGAWEIYPWDEDKTWGDYDGASSRYDWYTMPLTFGMNGYARGRGAGPWDREPGYFSGPLLANPEFRQRFLARLRDICQTMFTEAKLFPILDEMEKRLEPEVAIRAQANSASVRSAQTTFHSDIESIRRQIANRRKFLLSELVK